MSGSKKSTGFVTDISTITSVTDVAVLHNIIIALDKQVRRLEEDLSQATQKINQIVEENTRFKDEIVRFKARIIELEHRLGKTSRNALETLGTGTGDLLNRLDSSVPIPET